MRGFRLYSVVLICMVGLLGGCTHTTSIKTSKDSKPIYLTTVCMPVWTALGVMGALMLNDLDGYSLVGVAVGGAVDFVRCGWVPPRLTNEHPEALKKRLWQQHREAERKAAGKTVTQPTKYKSYDECVERRCKKFNHLVGGARYLCQQACKAQ
jgi:hypothetical protein